MGSLVREEKVRLFSRKSWEAVISVEDKPGFASQISVLTFTSRGELDQLKVK